MSRVTDKSSVKTFALRKEKQRFYFIFWALSFPCDSWSIQSQTEKKHGDRRELMLARTRMRFFVKEIICSEQRQVWAGVSRQVNKGSLAQPFLLLSSSTTFRFWPRTLSMKRTQRCFCGHSPEPRKCHLWFLGLFRTGWKNVGHHFRELWREKTLRRSVPWRHTMHGSYGMWD